MSSTNSQNAPQTQQDGPRITYSSPKVSEYGLTLETTLEAFLRTLEGKNRSEATRRAYNTDISQFIAWLHDNNIIIKSPVDVEKADISEYMAYLGRQNMTGLSRARKLAAIREYFRFLEGNGYIIKSPTTGVETPKKEKNGRTHLRPDEYNKMLALAGSNPRDHAVLTVFLQTGVRVSELCNLRLGDVDMEERVLRITSGKGMAARDIDLEKKGLKAVKNWLGVRPDVPYDHLFLNYKGEPITERGIRKLVVSYRDRAGITKKASCHSLRHSFATAKAEKGISPYQLQQWLGHANLNTTQIYIHLAKGNSRKLMEASSL